MKGIWENMICILAALWLCMSPLFLHVRMDSVVFNDTDIVGIFIATLSIIALATPQVWEELTKVILGVWLLASPWFLGFVHQTTVTDDILIVSTVIIILSLWSLINRYFASRSIHRHPKLPLTATEILLQTMNLQTGTTIVHKQAVGSDHLGKQRHKNMRT